MCFCVRECQTTTSSRWFLWLWELYLMAMSSLWALGRNTAAQILSSLLWSCSLLSVGLFPFVPVLAGCLWPLCEPCSEMVVVVVVIWVGV